MYDCAYVPVINDGFSEFFMLFERCNHKTDYALNDPFLFCHISELNFYSYFH